MRLLRRHILCELAAKGGQTALSSAHSESGYSVGKQKDACPSYIFDLNHHLHAIAFDAIACLVGGDDAEFQGLASGLVGQDDLGFK